jgi:hypothetical protein
LKLKIAVKSAVSWQPHTNSPFPKAILAARIALFFDEIARTEAPKEEHQLPVGGFESKLEVAEGSAKRSRIAGTGTPSQMQAVQGVTPPQ